MLNIQLKNVKSNFPKVIFDDANTLKHKLEKALHSSDQLLIHNLIKETEESLRQVQEGRHSYREKSSILQVVSNSWFQLWKRYNHEPSAIELGYAVDELTHYLTAYNYLFLSLHLINEDRSGDEEKDTDRIAEGFLLLSEIIDVFSVFFSKSELQQISESCKEVLFQSEKRDLKEYFQLGLNRSNVVTQLRAYCSLILVRVNICLSDGLSSTEQQALFHAQSGSRPAAWWQKTAEISSDSKAYDEAMRLGHEYRDNTNEVVDKNDSWTEQDQTDLTAVSLSYAASLYPESEDLI